ncbi:MAG: hypothetical protein AABZ30_02820 [Myxococcota bacterium]
MKTLLAALLATSAGAIPRFAVRTGFDCGSCHVNPTGGGIRTAFARNVFARQWLALPAGAEAMDEAFSPDIGRHIAIGTDVRPGYLWQNSPDPAFSDTSSLVTMQADLYVHARASPKLALYWDQGVYGGFETFVLVRPLGEREGWDFYVKAGHFVIPFGVREANHTIWTREAVGFGPRDRDNGAEVGFGLGRFSAQLAVVNGTYGDAFLDAGGTRELRVFDKAVSARMVFRARAGPLRVWHAASILYNDNVSQQSPLFLPALFPGSQGEAIPYGVNEWRFGGFLGLGLGRLGYAGEIVVVRDSFAAGIPTIVGYTSYQELAVTLFQGLDLVGTYEFADSDIEFERGRVDRRGGAIEFFPFPFLELRGMYRHSVGAKEWLLGGARDDVEIMVHLFL